MDIAKAVTRVVAFHLGIEEVRITRDARFIEDLGADSLDLYEVAMSLEEEFKLEIFDQDVDNMVKVGDAIEAIETKLAWSTRSAAADLSDSLPLR